MKTYQYKPKNKLIIMTILFFGVCTAVLYHKAKTNDRGLILNGIIEFQENGAATFFWILTACSAIFVILGIIMIIQKIKKNIPITISDDQISIPYGFVKKTIYHVLFKDINRIEEASISGQEFLYIYTEDKRHYITKDMIQTKDEYNEIVETLTNQLNNEDKPNNKVD